MLALPIINKIYFVQEQRLSTDGYFYIACQASEKFKASSFMFTYCSALLARRGGNKPYYWYPNLLPCYFMAQNSCPSVVLRAYSGINDLGVWWPGCVTSNIRKPGDISCSAY